VFGLIRLFRSLIVSPGSGFGVDTEGIELELELLRKTRLLEFIRRDACIRDTTINIRIRNRKSIRKTPKKLHLCSYLSVSINLGNTRPYTLHNSLQIATELFLFLSFIIWHLERFHDSECVGSDIIT
jgi:hypothetical protein